MKLLLAGHGQKFFKEKGGLRLSYTIVSIIDKGMVNDGIISDTHSKKYFGTKKKPLKSNFALVPGSFGSTHDEEKMTHI